MNNRNSRKNSFEKRGLTINNDRSLIGEWNQQTSGTYILSNDVKIKKTVKVEDGKALEITGIVGVDGIRPAIDGGGSPGCTSNNCPGHRVFSLDNTNDELRLTNIAIQNGHSVRFIILFSDF